jgi:hypothetical protein
MQADSHLDENANPQAYEATLRNIAAGTPDFFIDLGDTFMTDKRRSDFKKAFPQYLAQRYYFGLVCHSAPLFMVLGNHDGESGWRHNRTRDSMAAWSLELRRRYFPNPRPDGFYTGHDVTLMGWAANTQILGEKELEVPVTWDDLAKEEYKGMVGVASPAQSGTGMTFMTCLYDMAGGWDYIDKLNKNVFQYNSSGGAAGRQAARGEPSPLSPMIAVS